MRTKTLSAASFTLMEILITTSLLAISIGSVTAWTIGNLRSNELESTTKTLVSMLRETESMARRNWKNTEHGIAFEENSYTTYEGPSRDESEIESRQTFSLPSSTSISELDLENESTEILFKQKTGNTSSFGTITVSNSNASESYTISVSAIGLIDWQ